MKCLIICLLIFSSCKESPELKNKENVVTEQDLSNKPIYNIAIGDTVKIYGGSNGGLSVSHGLSMDSLNHLEYIGVENINPEKWFDCEGCKIPFAYVLIGTSAGTDTIFDEFRDYTKPSKVTLTTYSHIINIR
jgi:hypothetical protein